MKKMFASFCTLAAALMLNQPASALNYTNTDMLLVFRQTGFNDVEFDIGSVSNYLSLAPGTIKVVTNWSLGLVLSNNLNSLNGVTWAVIACTAYSPGASSDANWLTDSSSSDNPAYLKKTSTSLGAQNSVILQVGMDAATNTLGANQNLQYYVAAESTVGSYTYDTTINTGSGTSSSLNGTAPYCSISSVEQSIPGASRFFQVQTTNITPLPLLPQKGAFSIDKNGVLSYIAGVVPAPLPSPVLSISRQGTTNIISFASAANVNYRLLYSPVCGGDFTNWTMIANVVSGNNSVASFTNVVATNRFYGVQASYY